jgi:hypothetical protein
MHVHAIATATRAVVRRFDVLGTKAIAIAPSFLDRLHANAEWLLLVPLGWLAIHFVKAIRALLKLPETTP